MAKRFSHQHRICRGDTVAVIAGANKGTRGRVLRVLRDSDRIVVEGVNL
ncbi:MAG: KOW motif-containing protein, partial [Planctomycetota bacterium]